MNCRRLMDRPQAEVRTLPHRRHPRLHCAAQQYWLGDTLWVNTCLDDH